MKRYGGKVLEPAHDSLQTAKISRRLDALFRAMSTDFLLREQFVTEPSQVLAEYVGGKKLSDAAANASDQIVYAVMSNERLLERLKPAAAANQDFLQDHKQFASAFSTAVSDTNAKHVVNGLLRASAEGVSVTGPTSAVALIIWILNQGRPVPVTAGAPATETFITGHAVGSTEMSTGHATGTMVSTAHLVAGTEASGGTQMSTGHATGTMVSTAHLVAGTEASGGTQMSTGHTTGTMVSTAHLVAGTEASGGTQMSTGHATGTMVSTAHLVGGQGHTINPALFGGGPQRITLVALADYAATLRDQGALDAVF